MYKVIIIDDEPIIVEGLAKSISWDKWDCKVIGSAYNGLDGLELIRKERPDIIITDISMPEMNGLVMIAGLRSEFPQMQITILTGYRDFDYAQEAIRLGVNRFLLKPSKMEELDEAITFMTGHLKTIKPRAVSAEISVKPEEIEEDDVLYDSVASSFIVKNALAYIHENYNQKLRLVDVADEIFVSQWHLSKLLNKHTGKSFSDILNGVRVEKAKELLRNPSLRIGDIAEEVGFLDMTHFSRVFKKIAGMSANEYRNNM